MNIAQAYTYLNIIFLLQLLQIYGTYYKQESHEVIDVQLCVELLRNADIHI